jgi:hypothetical protein
MNKDDQDLTEHEKVMLAYAKRRCRNFFTKQTIRGLEDGMDEMMTKELLIWRKHAEENPYSIPGVSARVIEMLDAKIAERS